MLLDPARLVKVIINYLSDYVKKNNKFQYIIADDSPVVLSELLNRAGIPFTKVSNVTAELYAAARQTNGIVLDCRNKITQALRQYQKEDIADLYPFVELYPSELNLLSEYLKCKPDINSNLELEWVVEQDEINGIVSSDMDPTKHSAWLGYIGTQRILIAQLHQREKLTRHKKQLIEGLGIREMEGIVA
jgi:hypothetical protein